MGRGGGGAVEGVPRRGRDDCRGRRGKGDYGVCRATPRVVNSSEFGSLALSNRCQKSAQNTRRPRVGRNGNASLRAYVAVFVDRQGMCWQTRRVMGGMGWPRTPKTAGEELWTRSPTWMTAGCVRASSCASSVRGLPGNRFTTNSLRCFSTTFIFATFIHLHISLPFFVFNIAFLCRLPLSLSARAF